MLIAGLYFYLLGFGMGQVPSNELLNRLDDFNPPVRLEAAIEMAAAGDFYSTWLTKNFDRGTPNRKRALLLAVSLLSTPASLVILESQSRRMRSANSVHSYALFLYGMIHPEAADDLKETFKRATNSYERLCLIFGLCASPHRIQMAPLKTVLGRDKTVSVRAGFALLQSLRGVPAEWDANNTEGVLVGLLASHFPKQLGMTQKQITGLPHRAPQAWKEAARRMVPRDEQAWAALPMAGPAEARVFSLRELTEANRMKAALWFQGHVRTAQGRTWLYGHMVEMGLKLPLPKPGVWETGQVGAILLWGSQDFQAAQTAAILRLPAARLELERAIDPLDVWPEAALVAMAGQQEDFGWFQQVLNDDEGAIRRRFHPLWLLVSGRFSGNSARQELLANYARELGVGTAGFMDEHAWQMAALFLLSGTRAALASPEILRREELIESPLEHPQEDEVYADFLALLQSPLYRWKLPSPR
jgi:hypothetical protein